MGLGKVIWKTLADFGEYTSIGGLTNAGRTNSRAKQVYWMTLFCIGTYLTVINLISVVQDYLSYPVISSSDLTYQPSVAFPAVTICNQNRVHCVNLMTQQFRVKKSIESLITSTGSNYSDQINATYVRYDKLDKLVKRSKCKDQVCSTIYDKIPAVRLRTDNDVEIFYRVSLRCNLDMIDCYYLKCMTDFYNASQVTYDKSVAVAAWNTSKCSLQMACDYEPPPGIDYINPFPDCRSPVQTQPPPQQGRKKRQAGGGPPAGPSGSVRPQPPVKDDFDNDAVFLKDFMQLDLADQLAIGYKLTNQSGLLGNIQGFLTDCTYEGTDCSDPSYWHTFVSPRYGTCYTFNSVYKTQVDSYYPRNSSLTGKDYGLSLEMHLDQQYYMMNKLSKQAGARLVVHDPTVPALPDEYGLDLQPNTASSIAIQITSIERLPAPYVSNCTSFWNETSYPAVSNVTNYSLAACQRLCIQADIIRDCKCYHPGLVLSDTYESFTVSPCLVTPNTTKGSDSYCIQIITNAFNLQERQCPCNVPCSENIYSSSFSSSTWPSDQYWKDLAISVGYSQDELDAPGPRAQQIEDTIKKDFVKAVVYFQTLNVQSIVQSAKYTPDTFFASVGGSLGLYIGIAVIMMFEIIELIWDLIYNTWKYYNTPKSQDRSS